MEYRILPHRGERISVIGLGSGSITGTQQEMTAIIDAAIQTASTILIWRPLKRHPLQPMPRRLPGEGNKF